MKGKTGIFKLNSRELCCIFVPGSLCLGFGTWDLGAGFYDLDHFLTWMKSEGETIILLSANKPGIALVQLEISIQF